jgi:hypothetical protein
MKKLLMLFVLAGLVFSVSSCKKKDCPECEEPETVLRGVGTWNASKIISQNQDVTNSGDPQVNCWLTDVMILNENQNGTSWSFPTYDSNSGVCSDYGLQVTSWAESQQRLYVTVTYQGNFYDFSFIFVSDNEIKIEWGAPGELDIHYTKQ